MAEPKSWTLPPKHRPKPELLGFDVETALRSMVHLRTEIPEDAFTAGTLGTERAGHGVVIAAEGRQVIVTIGYLIAEAESIWISAHGGQVVPGHVLAYDYASGFGLVQPLGSLTAPALPRASAESLEIGDELTVLGHGGLAHCLAVRLVARHEFAGYWEYLLEDALYTAPVHPLWGGSALLNPAGALVGIGSLLVQQGEKAGQRDANLFVPIDGLEPILGELLRHGGRLQPPRPWLGLYSNEDDEHIVVAGLVADGPAHRAGVSLGDVVSEVDGEPVDSLPAFYRAVWSKGAAGVRVRLTLLRAGEPLDIEVHTASREQFLRQPQRH
jgi:S1-C subfamily serine protease